jgi:WS/DGAT/MGAT family acyltransferase
MANYVYERLSAQDASFLHFESPNTPMHLSWTWVFAGGTLTAPDGGVDIARIRQHVASRLYRFPRFRQRLAFTPLEGHPVWVDDEGFKLHYHVRHASLPDPGDDARLKTTTAAIISQPLDRSKPLWELWVVEGLAGGGFAVVSKTHHCMVDGVASVDLMTGLLDETPCAAAGEAPEWIPRPAPSAMALSRDAVVDRLRLASQVAGDGLAGLGSPGAPVRALLEIGRALTGGLPRAPETPFNRPVGPHRFVSWTRLPLEETRRIGRRLGATVGDVMLATIGGALGTFCARRGWTPSDGTLRVAVPGNPRPDVERGMLGNRASAWILCLPIDERDPVRRVHATVAELSRAKGTSPASPGEAWLRVAELAGHAGLGAAVRARQWLHSYNLIVTNIPGPRAARHLLDATLVEAYPQVPLFREQGLAVAVANYRDHLHVGLSADWDVVPDVGELALDVRESFAALQDAACPARPPVERSVATSGD